MISWFTPTNRVHRTDTLSFPSTTVGTSRANGLSSLADYVAPVDTGRKDYLGGFVSRPASGPRSWPPEFKAEHDDYTSIMVKSLADRLAEAFAEWLHEPARIDWGFGGRRT